jgi:hypothetical protein
MQIGVITLMRTLDPLTCANVLRVKNLFVSHVPL